MLLIWNIAAFGISPVLKVVTTEFRVDFYTIVFLLMTLSPTFMFKMPRYPQRPFIRTLMRMLGRLFLPVLARVEIEGLDRFPRKGPLIVVGNHTGAMEVVLLTIYAPRIIEYLGSVDIPHEGFVSVFIYLYDFIPVFRGNASRESLEAGLEVLRQDAVLGLFPEGGIWEPAIRRAQAGVAWLSYHGQAPVLPIGFGSTHGALGELLRLKRPKLTMRVGEPVPPVQIIQGTPRKQQLQEAADHIVDGIWALVPPEEHPVPTPITDETFDLEISISGTDGTPVALPDSLAPQHGPSMSKILHRTTLFNNLLENLNLPVGALKSLQTSPPVEDMLTAAKAILGYLETENPYYFTYRYGPAEGRAMGAAVQELHEMLSWASENSYHIHLKPIRRFRRTDTGERVTLEIPQEEDKW